MKDVAYIERTRDWYRALGYERDYVWAHFENVPFTPMAKSLSESTVAVIGTATPYDETGQPTLPKRVYSLPVDSAPERLYTDDLSWAKETTHTDDRESYLPIERLRELALAGRIGALAARFYGVPTEYSQRRTLSENAPRVLELVREDAVDVALLVPL